MKKLRLDPDSLAIETFQTEDVDGGTGTIEGYASFRCTPAPATCDGTSCPCLPGNDTWDC